MLTKNPERVGAGNAYSHREYTSQSLQSPAYSKSLTTLSPEHNELILLIGEDKNIWKHAKIKERRREPVLLLPDAHPERYFWPVYGWEVLVKQYGNFPLEKVPSIGQSLLGFGATIVRVLYLNKGEVGFVIYRPEARREA